MFKTSEHQREGVKTNWSLAEGCEPGLTTIGHYSIKKLRRKRAGFTIAELLFATLIVAVLISAAAGIYTNFFNSTRNLKAANLVYEEARFTMERIVREIRSGTVDYEEYFNQETKFTGHPLSINTTYGSNYCLYSQKFYNAGPDSTFGTFDDESTGKRNDTAPPPLSSPIQNALYLINNQGDKRTYFKKQVGTDGIGRVVMLKLTGHDFGLDHISSAQGGNNCKPDNAEGDGLIDTWLCEPGFKCTPLQYGTIDLVANSDCTGGSYHTITDNPTDLTASSFIDITPSTLDIVDLKFFITPVDDPYKAYADETTQIQPHVTVKLIARANPKIAAQFRGETPNIVLESTVSARSYNPIITECNKAECIPPPFNATQAEIDLASQHCPKDGVASGAKVVCSQGVFPLCTDDVYLSFVNTNLSYPPAGYLNNATDSKYHTYYESEDETGSCSKAFTTEAEREACKAERCGDGYDNDGDGLKDGDDLACIEDLCHDGLESVATQEICIDVGGKCRWRPKLLQETRETCFDGYDNDCDDKADELDDDCIALICSDGLLSPSAGVEFVDSTYSQPGYLVGAPTNVNSDLNEECIDIGGLCDTAVRIVNGNPVTQNKTTGETGDQCYDGLDNDCDYQEDVGGDPIVGTGADEFDSECKSVICSNGNLDDLLAHSPIHRHDYLFDYRQDVAKASAESTSEDEQCTDAGGVCGATISEVYDPLDTSTGALCRDGKDNDCNELIDQADPGCCPDSDNDSFSPLIQDVIGDVCTPLPGSVDSNGIILFAGEIDCDDSNNGIKPGATEVCDGATYDSGPLAGQPIDNNCSFVNGFTVSAHDSNDPSCCNDEDSDGFGVKDAYLYENTSTGECALSVAQNKFDCNDTDPAIHPDAAEVCNLAGDQNCSGPQDDLDADDGTDEKDLACCTDVDSDGKYGGPSCIPLGQTTADEFDCDDSNPLVHPGISIEVCDNTLDDDCNAKTDTLDDYCQYSSKTRFLDNLTTLDFIVNPLASELTHTTGSIQLKAGESAGVVESELLPVDASCSSISNAQLVNLVHDLDGGDGTNEDISIQFSNNNGSTWCGDDDCSTDWISLTEFLSGNTTVSFSGAGSELKWKAKITDLNSDNAILIDTIDISFTCS